MPTEQILPAIKWPGGKRQLLPTITELMPKGIGSYYEPFIGGGALFFSSHPYGSTINDLNSALMATYLQIKINADAVCDAMDRIQTEYNSLPSKNEKDAYYYQLRDSFNHRTLSSLHTPEMAAIFIFLNKAGFNGLYRVNRDGKFNVPSAHKDNIHLYARENIKSMSALLSDTCLQCGDFISGYASAKRGDFVLFDPPYYGTFDNYQEGGFSEADHKALFNLYQTLSRRGVYCMQTNNDCEYIRNLYYDYTIIPVDVKRNINRDGKNRTGREIIIINYIPNYDVSVA